MCSCPRMVLIWFQGWALFVTHQLGTSSAFQNATQEKTNRLQSVSSSQKSTTWPSNSYRSIPISPPQTFQLSVLTSNPVIQMMSLATYLENFQNHLANGLLAGLILLMQILCCLLSFLFLGLQKIEVWTRPVAACKKSFTTRKREQERQCRWMVNTILLSCWLFFLFTFFPIKEHYIHLLLQLFWSTEKELSLESLTLGFCWICVKKKTGHFTEELDK